MLTKKAYKFKCTGELCGRSPPRRAKAVSNGRELRRFRTRCAFRGNPIASEERWEDFEANHWKINWIKLYEIGKFINLSRKLTCKPFHDKRWHLDRRCRSQKADIFDDKRRFELPRREVSKSGKVSWTNPSRTTSFSCHTTTPASCRLLDELQSLKSTCKTAWASLLTLVSPNRRCECVVESKK